MTMTVRDVMTPEVVTVVEDVPFKEAAGLLAAYRVGALPVLDGTGHVVGIVSESDLLLKQELPHAADGGSLFEGRHRRIERLHAAGRTAGSVMTTPAVTVGLNSAVAEAARLMHAHRVRHLPVVDVTGKLVGIVSRSDLLKAFLRHDDSILAEVRGLLAVHPDVDPDRVTARVADGVVTLIGSLGRRSTTEALTRLVRELDGVVGVDAALDYETDDLSIPYPMLRPIL